MTKETKYIYAKFFKADQIFERSFKLSIDKGIFEWDGKVEKKTKSKKKGVTKNAQDLSFFELNQKIFKDFNSFYSIVPSLIAFSLITPGIALKSDTLKLIRDKGEIIEEDNDVVKAKLDTKYASQIDKIAKKAEDLSAISRQFPSIYVVGLITIYDYFIYNLVKIVINKNPNIIFSSEKTITFEQIGSCDTIEDLKSELQEKEIGIILRKSHTEQLDWFSKTIGMKIEPEDRLKGRFVELCERRNLFTHVGGVVTSDYLRKCKSVNFDTGNLKIGDYLKVDKIYLRESIETVIEISAQLLYVVWNKVDPEGAKDSSKSLINIVYNLILEEKFDLSIRIIEFVIGNKSARMDDGTRKRHIVNLANAKKMRGDEDYLEIVDIEDWSAATLDFKVCVSAIKGDVDDFVHVMSLSVNGNHISKEDLTEWPVFKSMRVEKKVKDKFFELFGSNIERGDLGHIEE